MATQATLPLNTFKSLVHDVTSVPTTVYTTPAGVTTVVLLSQVSNIHSSNTVYVSAYISRGSVILDTFVNTYLIKNFPVPINDATSLLTGKLILQENDNFVIYGSANNTAQLVLSYLETANA